MYSEIVVVQIDIHFGESHPSPKEAGGGSIISEYYVLTAAHVIKDNVSVAATAFLRPKATNALKAFAVEAAEIIPHPRYNVSTLENDIALIRLHSPLRFNEMMKPICLPTHPLRLSNREAFLAGWGDTGSNPDGWLRFVKLKILPFRFCLRHNYNPAYGDYFTKDYILCTESRGKNPCHGDSGSALVIWDKHRKRFLEVGVVSFADKDNCINKTDPVVFTRVSKFVPWIREVLAEDTKELKENIK
ncbi:hypothetical protein MTO96_030853 [Rhipicephalus appendiculatus]